MVTGSRKDIGLEKFFKSSLLSSVKRKNLRTMVLQVLSAARDDVRVITSSSLSLLRHSRTTRV